jgi:hypothetical protein
MNLDNSKIGVHACIYREGIKTGRKIMQQTIMTARRKGTERLERWFNT